MFYGKYKFRGEDRSGTLKYDEEYSIMIVPKTVCVMENGIVVFDEIRPEIYHLYVIDDRINPLHHGGEFFQITAMITYTTLLELLDDWNIAGVEKENMYTLTNMIKFADTNTYAAKMHRSLSKEDEEIFCYPYYPGECAPPYISRTSAVFIEHPRSCSRSETKDVYVGIAGEPEYNRERINQIAENCISKDIICEIPSDMEFSFDWQKEKVWNYWRRKLSYCSHIIVATGMDDSVDDSIPYSISRYMYLNITTLSHGYTCFGFDFGNDIEFVDVSKDEDLKRCRELIRNPYQPRVIKNLLEN